MTIDQNYEKSFDFKALLLNPYVS